MPSSTVCAYPVGCIDTVCPYDTFHKTIPSATAARVDRIAFDLEALPREILQHILFWLVINVWEDSICPGRHYHPSSSLETLELEFLGPDRATIRAGYEVPKAVARVAMVNHTFNTIMYCAFQDVMRTVGRKLSLRRNAWRSSVTEWIKRQVQAEAILEFDSSNGDGVLEDEIDITRFCDCRQTALQLAKDVKHHSHADKDMDCVIYNMRLLGCKLWPSKNWDCFLDLNPRPVSPRDQLAAARWRLGLRLGDNRFRYFEKRC
ncbi:MAG: hypothetical protein M1828_005159 [Chrysothrix sp. TS-e1954]|nr:MAG: hypothetical protein M1828_005159 [Chrysothrix sp. TS-e1954]